MNCHGFKPVAIHGNSENKKAHPIKSDELIIFKKYD